ncbi:uncharacterized protein BROUX77_004138 [Berkeleyomyces rouxiae]|uniref:uncharacterized protein n=1 Tax=Berkeleyomyces rouxiae TaxID=2035830 RepID=UPI003B79D13A
MVAFPPPLLHKCAAPVSSAEFAEVVQRLCTPRFPSLRPHSSRKIALAVSGGLDSMALAVLFSQFLKHYPRANIGDARVSGAEALIIDHSLRPGSLLEAKNVATEVQRLPGIRPVVASIDWTQYGHTNPEGSELDCSSTVEGKASSSISSASSAPNLETLARQARYQLLGKLCMKYGADSLFFAHHRSDVYETVLLRLLSGASRRGLSGIRSHGDIPECYGMFGVHRSGLAKALHDKQSYLTTNMLPADLSSVRHRLRYELHNDIEREKNRQRQRGYWNKRTDESWSLGKSTNTHFQVETRLDSCIPDWKKIDRKSAGLVDVIPDDGGVHIYRPLLPFDKDRLRATCLEHGVNWVEDKTNADPTVTKRNAIRYMAAHYTLPRALQKDAILKLADECASLNKQEANTAKWLLSRTELRLDSQLGTLRVRVPVLGVSIRDQQWRRRQPLGNSSPKGRQSLRKRLRVDRLRTPAAILVQKLIHAVSPREHFPNLPAIDPFVSRIFPDIFALKPLLPPKAFCLGGVLFTPLPHTSHAYFLLSRQPYSSLQRPPAISYASKTQYTTQAPSNIPSWHPTHLWDGRYWFRLRHRLPGRIVIAPLTPAHLSEFRRQLPRTSRCALDEALRACAPGNIRFTLPALYFDGTISVAQGEKVPMPHEDLSLDCVGTDEGVGVKRIKKMTILALPTLGYALPEASQQVEWQIFYKMVDNDIKAHADGVPKNQE